jgi:hypothetical protein
MVGCHAKAVTRTLCSKYCIVLRCKRYTRLSPKELYEPGAGLLSSYKATDPVDDATPRRNGFLYAIGQKWTSRIAKGVASVWIIVLAKKNQPCDVSC